MLDIEMFVFCGVKKKGGGLDGEGGVGWCVLLVWWGRMVMGEEGRLIT